MKFFLKNIITYFLNYEKYIDLRNQYEEKQKWISKNKFNPKEYTTYVEALEEDENSDLTFVKKPIKEIDLSDLEKDGYILCDLNRGNGPVLAFAPKEEK